MPIPARRTLLALTAAGVAAVAALALLLAREQEPAPVATPLLQRYGCDTCHGEGGPYRERLRPAATRSEEELVARILHAERFAPGTRMPTYAGTIDEATARALAAEAQAVSRSLPQPPTPPTDRSSTQRDRPTPSGVAGP